MSEKKRTILVVEDDKFLLKVLDDKLSREGYTVLVAHDGNEAMMKFKKGPLPDLVLLDLVMPFKSGFEVLEEMQASKKLKKIPVIVASNLGQDSDVEKAMDLGAVDYLIKSDFTISEVIARMEKQLPPKKK
ncbi:response regulator [Patescibacteria group bacterium]|nr:response regulator [Patescibacteria group bacterium]